MLMLSMKPLRFWRKKLIKAGVVLLLIAAGVGGYFGYQKYQDSKKPVVELSADARTSLKSGKCSDEEVSAIKTSAESQKDIVKETEGYQDLANCHLYRKDYDSAIKALEKVASLYDKQDNQELSNNAKSVIESIKRVRDLPPSVEETPGENNPDAPVENFEE